MNREKVLRAGRFAGCALLLALLVASSSAAVKPVQVAGVPVSAYTVSNQERLAATIEETTKKLETQREQGLTLLQSVLEDPRAQQEQIAEAHEKKIQIAQRIETEAAISAQLAHMGFEAVVVMGDGSLNIIAPWQIAENEQNRVRMIDAAVSLSGFPADAVKIILAKK